MGNLCLNIRHLLYLIVAFLDRFDIIKYQIKGNFMQIGGLLFFGSVVGSVLGASYLVDKSGGKITAWTKEKGFCKDISFSE